MSARDGRFEVVRSDAGWHTRYRARNGRNVWTTEVYTRRAAAYDALTHFVRGSFAAVAGAVTDVDERGSES